MNKLILLKNQKWNNMAAAMTFLFYWSNIDYGDCV